jgi:hypothetical protein
MSKTRRLRRSKRVRKLRSIASRRARRSVSARRQAQGRPAGSPSAPERSGRYLDTPGEPSALLALLPCTPAQQGRSA